jgi:hypothetical protein
MTIALLDNLDGKYVKGWHKNNFFEPILETTTNKNEAMKFKSYSEFSDWYNLFYWHGFSYKLIKG